MVLHCYIAGIADGDNLFLLYHTDTEFQKLAAKCYKDLLKQVRMRQGLT